MQHQCIMRLQSNHPVVSRVLFVSRKQFLKKTRQSFVFFSSDFLVHGRRLVGTVPGQRSDFHLDNSVSSLLVSGHIHAGEHSGEEPSHPVFGHLVFHLLKLCSRNSFDHFQPHVLEKFAKSPKSFCFDDPIYFLLYFVFHKVVHARIQKFQSKSSFFTFCQ